MGREVEDAEGDSHRTRAPWTPRGLSDQRAFVSRGIWGVARAGPGHRLDTPSFVLLGDFSLASRASGARRPSGIPRSVHALSTESRGYPVAPHYSDSVAVVSPAHNNTHNASTPGSSHEPEQTLSGLAPESPPRSPRSPSQGRPCQGRPRRSAPVPALRPPHGSCAGIECHVLESLLFVGGFAVILLLLTHLLSRAGGASQRKCGRWLSVTQCERRVESAFHANEEQGRRNVFL